jgi:hypothetical protein
MHKILLFLNLHRNPVEFDAMKLTVHRGEWAEGLRLKFLFVDPPYILRVYHPTVIPAASLEVHHGVIIPIKKNDYEIK